MKKVVKLFWVFLIGSIIGYVLEMIVGLVQNGHFVSRQGLLIGPFIQVYGLGLVTYYLVISKIKNKNNIDNSLFPVLLYQSCRMRRQQQLKIFFRSGRTRQEKIKKVVDKHEAT